MKGLVIQFSNFGMEIVEYMLSVDKKFTHIKEKQYDWSPTLTKVVGQLATGRIEM